MKKLIPIFLVLFLFSCGNDTPDNSPIIGKWEGTSWKVDGEESGRDASRVKFEFMPSGSYSAAFGAQNEKGNFKIKGNKLYTTAEGQIEKMVQVVLKGNDTLEMDMNRVGTPEVLTLVRK